MPLWIGSWVTGRNFVPQIPNEVPGGEEEEENEEEQGGNRNGSRAR
jgi:hypothetical protein